MFFDLRTVESNPIDVHFVLPSCGLPELSRQAILKMNSSQQKIWYQLYQINELMKNITPNVAKLQACGIDMTAPTLTKYKWCGRHDPYRFTVTTFVNPMNLAHRMKALTEQLDEFDRRRALEQKEEQAYWVKHFADIVAEPEDEPPERSMFSDDAPVIDFDSESDGGDDIDDEF
jgi:hypothetical protein